MRTDELTTRRTVVLSPAGMPAFRLNFSYGAILSMDDAGPLLAQWQIDNVAYNPTTAPQRAQQQLMEDSVLSA